MNNFLKKAMPHISAIILYIIVSAAYFAPQFDGQALRQSDMVHHGGMNRDIVEHQDRYDEHPQWAGRMFGGMPAYVIDMNYDGRLIKEGYSVLYFLGEPASYIFLAMAGFYFMLLCFRVNPWVAIVGGLAYGLSSYFFIIIGVGHITKMMALAFVAPMVGAVFLAYRGKLWLGASLAGIFASIEISCSHPQITYYFLFVLLALVINEAVTAFKEKALPRFGKATAVLAVAAALAIGSNVVQLYYVNDYAKDTTRSASELTVADNANSTSGLDKDYATAWSYGKMETLNLFIPNLMGGSSAGGFAADGEVADALSKYNARNIATKLPAYWGPQPGTSGPVYIGAIAIFLFVFSLFVLRGRQKWWILAVLALSIMLAWGHNMMWLSSLMLDHFPLYNKFRTVSMILVIAEWAIPLLGVLALQKLWEGSIEKPQAVKALKYSIYITGGLALAVALVGSGLFSFAGQSDGAMGLPEDVISAMVSERASLMAADAWRSLAFVLMGGGVIWMFTAGKLKKSVMIVCFAALVMADMITVDRRYLSSEDFMPQRQAREIAATDADRQILADTTNYRVANMSVDMFNDATTSRFHRSVGGYSAAKLRRYQDVIERHLSKNNMAVYDMLNTKYFIVPKDGEPTVMLNDGAMGSAWYVDNVEYVDSPDAEIAALDTVNPRVTAVVDKVFEPVIGRSNVNADSSAMVAMTEYRVNRQVYRTSAATEGVVVFSEIYYPKGWTAYIDGVEAPYFRADYILRAMVVPAGEHTVEFRFAAPHFVMVESITYISSIILILGFLISIAFTIWQTKKQ